MCVHAHLAMEVLSLYVSLPILQGRSDVKLSAYKGELRPEHTQGILDLETGCVRV